MRVLRLNKLPGPKEVAAELSRDGPIDSKICEKIFKESKVFADCKSVTAQKLRSLGRSAQVSQIR